MMNTFCYILLLGGCQMFPILSYISLFAPSANSAYFATSFGRNRRNLSPKRIDSTFCNIHRKVNERSYEILHNFEARNRFQLLSAVTDDDFVKSDNVEGLQSLFSKYCDKDGLMSKDSARRVPVIAELLLDDNILPEEFDSIWNRCPKFPDERIDIYSWMELYRNIDDLFEDTDDDDVDDSSQTTKTVVSEVKDSIVITKQYQDMEDISSEKLESIFLDLAGSSGLISKTTLYAWDEIISLMKDGLLGLEELDELWKETPKMSPEQLTLPEFLLFNTALDKLFDFDDSESDDNVVANQQEPERSNIVSEENSLRRVVTETGLDPETLHLAIADSDGLVGPNELKLWGEMQEMLNTGDLLQSELEKFFSTCPKSDNNKLDVDGFLSLYKAIFELFETDDDDDDDDGENLNMEIIKKELFDAIEDLNDEDKLPCGLEATSREKDQILALVDELEMSPENFVRKRNGVIIQEDLAGNWDLIYSSSSAMNFNKGLSGLGGSFPNGKFGGLQQNLKSSKYMMDIEYIEHINVKPSTASFDVLVNGSWDLRSSISLFTGEPSIVMTVLPDRVSYGPTSTRADHWKSLGPLNMLDLCYLDNNIRIMRGNTAVENVFIYKRRN